MPPLDPAKTAPGHSNHILDGVSEAVNNPVRMPGYGASQTAQTDAGLRAHMLGVFRNMGLGLVITGLVAALVGNTPALAAAIYGTPLKWVAIFAPLAFVFFFSFRIDRMTTVSSITPAVWGSRSLIHWPLSPRLANL